MALSFPRVGWRFRLGSCSGLLSSAICCVENVSVINLMNITMLLIIIAILLFLILIELGKINSRLKERFPTEKEQDYQWSQRDPMGHWEAHENDKDNSD